MDLTKLNDFVSAFDRELAIFVSASASPTPSMESRNVPSGSSDPITYEDIKDGDTMVDFNDESKFGRYYHKSTLPYLNGKNPFTKNPIENPTYYIAKLVSGGKRRRKTRKNRKTKRAKTHKRK